MSDEPARSWPRVTPPKAVAADVGQGGRAKDLVVRLGLAEGLAGRAGRRAGVDVAGIRSRAQEDPESSGPPAIVSWLSRVVPIGAVPQAIALRGMVPRPDEARLMSWSGMSWSGASAKAMSWSGIAPTGEVARLMSWSGMSWSGEATQSMSWSGMSWSGDVARLMSWRGMSWSGE